MARIIVVSDAQQEIQEKISFAMYSEPVQKGEKKTIEFDMHPYTSTQLRGLFNRVHNSIEIPK